MSFHVGWLPFFHFRTPPVEFILFEMTRGVRRVCLAMLLVLPEKLCSVLSISHEYYHIHSSLCMRHIYLIGHDCNRP